MMNMMGDGEPLVCKVYNIVYYVFFDAYILMYNLLLHQRRDADDEYDGRRRAPRLQGMPRK